MKHLIGKEVFLRGTGNHKPRSGSDHLVKAMVVSAAKVNAEVLIDGYSNNKKVRHYISRDTGKLCFDAGSNYGYEVYESEQALNDQIRAEHIAMKITNKYRYTGDFAKVELGALEAVAKLLGLDDLEKDM